MSSPVGALAPGKVNLCLFVGPLRADGRHELVSVMQSVSLADRVTLEELNWKETDTVVCGAVAGPNLALEAVRIFRDATGWNGAPQRITIDKRVPVAAGMAGGSADAAAVLRLLARLAGGPDDEELRLIAFELGADVPSQLRPGRSLVTGAGERVEALTGTRPLGVLVLPSHAQLSTADVYAEADRLGATRSAPELDQLLSDVRAAGPALPRELVVNDLENAAISLEPSILDALQLARGAGADVAMVSGSGPTVVGLYCGAEGVSRAEAAAHGLAGSIAAFAVDAAFAPVGFEP